MIAGKTYIIIKIAYFPDQEIDPGGRSVIASPLIFLYAHLTIIMRCLPYSTEYFPCPSLSNQDYRTESFRHYTEVSLKFLMILSFKQANVNLFKCANYTDILLYVGLLVLIICVAGNDFM